MIMGFFLFVGFVFMVMVFQWVFWLLVLIMVFVVLVMVFVKKFVYLVLLLVVVMICLVVQYVSQEVFFFFVVQIIVYIGVILMFFFFVVMFVGVDFIDFFKEIFKGYKVVVMIVVLVFVVLLILVVGNVVMIGVIGIDYLVGLGQVNIVGGNNVKLFVELVFIKYVIVFEVILVLFIIVVVGMMVLVYGEVDKKKFQCEWVIDCMVVYVEYGFYFGVCFNFGVYVCMNQIGVLVLLFDGMVVQDLILGILVICGVIIDVGELKVLMYWVFVLISVVCYEV